MAMHRIQKRQMGKRRAFALILFLIAKPHCQADGGKAHLKDECPSKAALVFKPESTKC